MFQCEICKELKRPLILNVCSDCDPELHEAYNKALNSVIDWDTVTDEMVKSYQLIEDRKVNGWGKGKPIGILNNE